MFVRSTKVIGHDEAAAVFTAAGLELKPWSQDETNTYAHADEGTGEFTEVFAMWGLGILCTVVYEAAERQGEELERLVRRDPLTGVGNRRMLSEQLTHELARHSRIRRPLSVLALDLNGFKALNDQFGHAAGDQLLCDVARAIERVVGDDATVVRQGGDEFCVLLPHTTGEHALPTANAIRAELAVIEAHGLTITTGIGIASFPTEATTAEGLLHVADELLRASKETALARERRGRGHGPTDAIVASALKR